MDQAAEQRSMSSVSAQGWLTPSASVGSTDNRSRHRSPLTSHLHPTNATAISQHPQGGDSIRLHLVQVRQVSRQSRTSSGAALSSIGSERSSFSTSGDLDSSVRQHAAWPREFVPDMRYVEQAVSYSMAVIPTATPDNQYLGFCHGAVNLQNGERKASFQKNKEAGAWSRNGSNRKTSTPYFMTCREQKCAFRSNFVSSDAELLWTKVHVFPDRGIKIRWSFLAKSHVPQRVVLGGQYSFKCLFCVYLGRTDAMVFNGMNHYLSHISLEHRGKPLGEVIEYKTRAVVDRIADDKEQFDINVWPTTANKGAIVSDWLSDEYLDPSYRSRQNTIGSTKEHSGGLGSQLELTDEGQLSEDENDVANASLAARAKDLFGPRQHFVPVDLADNPLAPQHTVSEVINECEDNPWAEADMSSPSMRSDPNGHQVGVSLVHLSAEEPLARDEDTDSAPVPDIPPRSQLRQQDTYVRQTQVKVLDHDDNFTTCLNDIAQLFDDALAILAEMKQQAARYQRAPPPSLLEHTFLDIGSGFERQRQRALARHGQAFELADPTAIIALQRVLIYLHNRLLRPLGRAANDPSIDDFGGLIDAAEDGAHRTATVMQELKERLSQSPAQSRPSEQPQGQFQPSLARSLNTQEYLNDDSAPNSERQASSASTTSSPHTAGNEYLDTRRRPSVLSFFKHSRNKSNGDAASGLAKPTHSISVRHGMIKLDFRNRKRETSKDMEPKAFELDGEGTQISRT